MRGALYEWQRKREGLRGRTCVWMVEGTAVAVNMLSKNEAWVSVLLWVLASPSFPKLWVAKQTKRTQAKQIYEYVIRPHTIATICARPAMSTRCWTKARCVYRQTCHGSSMVLSMRRSKQHIMQYQVFEKIVLGSNISIGCF